MPGEDAFADLTIGTVETLEDELGVYQVKQVNTFVWHGEWLGQPCQKGGGGFSIHRESAAIEFDFPDLNGFDFGGWAAARLIVAHDVYMVSPYAEWRCQDGGVFGFTGPLGYTGLIRQAGEEVWVVTDPPGGPPEVQEDAHEPPRFSFNAWTLLPPISIPYFTYVLTSGTSPGGGHFGFCSAAGGMGVVLQRMFDPEIVPDPPIDDPFVPVPTYTHGMFPLPPCVPGGGGVVAGEAKQGTVLDPPRPVGRKYG